MRQWQGRQWLLLLVAAAVLSQATVHLVRPTTTYKLLELEATALTVGGVTGIYALLPLIAALQVGARTQRAVSLKSFLVIGSLIVSIGVALVALAGSVWLVALGSALLGLGQLVFSIAGQAAIARFASNDQLDKAFGWFTAGFAAGQMLGPLIGGAMLNAPKSPDPADGQSTVDFTLWIGVVLSLLALALLQFSGRSLYRKNADHDDERPPEDAELLPRNEDISSDACEGKPNARKILRITGIKSHLLASIALLAIVDILAAFLPLLGEENGISPMWIGVLLAVRAGASIISRLMLPALRRRFSRSQLVLASLLVSGSTLVVSPATLDWLWVAVLLFMVAGFFQGIGPPLTMSAVTEEVPVRWRSSALALRLMGNRVGQVGVPVIAGLAAAPLGPAGAIWVSCLVLLVSGTEKALSYRDRGG